MANFVFSDNVNTTLASGISSTATSLTLSSTFGLPASIPAGFVYVISLNDAATRGNFEIIYATAISGATLSGLQRAQEGTAALTWLTGDFAYNGVTAGQMTQLAANPAMQAFTSSGTFVVPAGITELKLRMWGGGGGGGSGVATGSAGSGGGGGGYLERFIGVSPAQSLSITVGAAGVGAVGSTNGTAGGTSVVGPITATGGGGGFFSAGGGQTSVGSGGVGSGGVFNFQAQTGGQGLSIGGTGLGGPGGSSFAGPGSPSGAGAGATPGGGGGGGANASSGGSGGNGGAGLVIVEW